MSSNLQIAFAVLASGLSLSALAFETNVTTLAELRAAIADTVNVPNGSTIVLGKGTYDVSSDAGGAIDIGRSLTLKGATANPRDTVLSGGGVINVLYLHGTDSLACNLTLTNGLPPLIDSRKWYRGGGVWVQGSSAIVSNCVVTGCHFDTRTDYQEGTVIAEMKQFSGVGAYVNGGGLLTQTLIENCWGYNDVTKLVTANGGGLFVAGTSGGVYARAVDCEVRNCSMVTMSSGGGTTALAGGGVQVADGGRATHCRIHHNTLLSADGSSRCYGGGLLVTGGGIVSDSFIFCNTNLLSSGDGGSGGGVAIEGSGLVCSSTISNNYCYGSGGGVFHINTPTYGLRDSLIVDNTAVKSGGGGYGGPTVAGCAFRRNVGSQAGAWLSGSAVGWFSNCVFEANTTAAKFGEAKALYIQRSGEKPFELVNCWFAGHHLNDSKAILQFGGSPLPKYRAHIRNCVFIDNSGGNPIYSTYGSDTAGVLAPEIDNCTFVAEKSGSYAIGEYKHATNLVVRNCLFYGFQYGGLPPNLASSNPEHVSNCYDQVSTTLPKDAGGNVANGCLSGADVGAPGFYGLGSSNVTLKASSPLIGKGRVLDWMTNSDGSPNSAARDAGRGTCEVRKSGDYGIAIRFGRNRVRYEGGKNAPDIGAYEYFPHGILQYVK